MKLHPLRSTLGYGYTTFGCMWKQGECTTETDYVCRTKEGKEVPMQSRITAYWPDGSVKWTAHTADAALMGEEIEVLPGKSSDFTGMELVETDSAYIVKAGIITITVEKDGRHLFTNAERYGKSYLNNAEAVLLLEEPTVVNG